MPRRATKALVGLIFLALSLPVAGPPLKAESAQNCPCLSYGGEPGPGDCPCNTTQCYYRCVQELCPAFPQCTFVCTTRCSCYTQVSGCYTHEDPGPTPSPAPTCAGDCDGNGQVTVDEIVRGVNIVMDSVSVDNCRNLDRNDDSRISVYEIMQAVYTALYGCRRSADHP